MLIIGGGQFGGGQSGRYNWGARMQRAGGMGVVKVQAVGAGAIDQRGDGGRIGLAVANHMGAPLGHFQARQGG